MLGGDLLADVLDGGDGLAGAVVDGLAAGVDAGEIAGVRDGLGPGEKIGGLVVVEAAAFFLIEKDDGVGGEVFALGGGDGCCGVFFAERSWGGAGSLCLFDLGVEFAVGQDQKAEVVMQENVAFALPAVLVLAGRVGEPVAGEGEVPAQGGQGVVAGIVVAVEADWVLRRPGGGCG